MGAAMTAVGPLARRPRLTAVRLELAKMRRLRTVPVAAALVAATVALSGTDLFSDSARAGFSAPGSHVWERLLLSCTILLLNTTLIFSKVLLSRIVILASCTLCLCFSEGRSRSYLRRRLSCVLNNLGKAISVYNVRRNLAACLDLSQDLCLKSLKSLLL